MLKTSECDRVKCWQLSYLGSIAVYFYGNDNVSIVYCLPHTLESTDISPRCLSSDWSRVGQGYLKAHSWQTQSTSSASAIVLDAAYWHCTQGRRSSCSICGASSHQNICRTYIPHNHSHVPPSSQHSHWRYVLKIHFFIESGLKMIQFKIQFKTKSRIFIQQNIPSIESRIFNKIIHS